MDACSPIVEPISLRNPLLLYPILPSGILYLLCPFPPSVIKCVGVTGSNYLNKLLVTAAIHYKGADVTESKGHGMIPTYTVAFVCVLVLPLQ